jgi:hypothetical protein
VREKIELPVRDSHHHNRIFWRLPKLGTIRHILTNPLYAGAYIYPRNKTITRIVDGKPVKSVVNTPPEEYQVVIRDLFPSYITWEEFEHNQKLIANNAAMKGRMARGAVRKGEALLVGLIYCQRCGRRMHVRYRASTVSPTYTCRSTIMGGDVKPCPAFQSRRIEPLIITEFLRVLQPHALEAAIQTEEKLRQEVEQQRQAYSYKLEQARYEADRIKRQLDNVEPEKGLVFREFTTRWEKALQYCNDLQQREAQTPAPEPITEQERALLLMLPQDLNQVWNHPATSVQTKKRLLRTLINQIWVQKREDSCWLATIHWHGGVHTELLIQRVQPRRMSVKDDPSRELIHVIKQLTSCANDTQIARVLNLLKRKTHEGHAWTKSDVAQFRATHHLAAFSPEAYEKRGWFNLTTAAKELGINIMSVKKLIKQKFIHATQVVP